jgi:hypothetical protein
MILNGTHQLLFCYTGGSTAASSEHYMLMSPEREASSCENKAHFKYPETTATNKN